MENGTESVLCEKAGAEKGDAMQVIYIHGCSIGFVLETSIALVVSSIVRMEQPRTILIRRRMVTLTARMFFIFSTTSDVGELGRIFRSEFQIVSRWNGEIIRSVSFNVSGFLDDRYIDRFPILWIRYDFVRLK